MPASTHLRGDLCFQCDNCHHLRDMRLDASFPTHLSDLAARWLYVRHLRHRLRPALPDAITSSEVKENIEAEAAAKDGFVLLDQQIYTLNAITTQEERDRLIRKQVRKQRGSSRIKADQAKKKPKTEL
jgi:hypothetical protein